MVNIMTYHLTNVDDVWCVDEYWCIVINVQYCDIKQQHHLHITVCTIIHNVISVPVVKNSWVAFLAYFSVIERL